MQTPAERAYPTHWEADVVLRDGGTARVRPITPDDADRLVTFYEQVSDESKYYRFFAPYPRLSARDVHHFTHHDYVDRVGLAATVGGQIIATVRYDRIDDAGRAATGSADAAEVAFLVQDAHQGRGVASALLEHIGAVARERGIRRFLAEVLPANRKMVKVFTDAGYSQQRSFEDGAVRLTFDLEPTEQSLAVMHGREQRAEARSVQRLLAPASIAVIGASRRPRGAGRAVLDSLRAGGFTGEVYAVNHAAEPATLIGGTAVYRSVADIPHAPDLAVLALPAAGVPDVVEACGARGVQGLLLLSAGFSRDGQRALVHQARSLGMRVIGPNAFGVVNTSPGVRLNAIPSPQAPARGRIGLFTQSGAIGIALLTGLHRCGAGLSTFVSAGNRADVSGNDLLQFWDDDPDTDVALMYLESIGNPRKFTRLARRIAVRKPVVVVKGARHSASTPPPGHAAPAPSTPDATVTSLLRQAGVLLVDTVTEQVDTGVLLAHQPLPAGPRTAVFGNTESLCLLTYDAALTEGLRPRPVRDLTTSATPEDFRRALRDALDDPDVDAAVVTVIPWVGNTPVEELADTLRQETAQADKPVAVVHLAIEGLDEALALRGIPSYPAPERAVRALSQAVRHAAVAARRRRAGQGPRVPRIRRRRARRRPAASARRPRRADPGPVNCRRQPARERFRSVPLDGADSVELLRLYGIAVEQVRPAPSPDAAVAAAEATGYPVALKTTAPHLRHRADLGGVRLDITDEAGLRRAYAELTSALGGSDELRPVIQAMAPRGVDTVVRAALDPAIGAVLSFGLAGTPSELLGDVAHRLVPATDRDASSLVRALRSAPMLFGWRGAQPVDTAALEELLLRVSRLLDDQPQIVAVDLEPVVVAARGLTVLGAAVRVAEPLPPADLGPRRLPAY